jgi:hypothetical protein
MDWSSFENVRKVMNLSTSDSVYMDESWLLMRWDPEHRCVFAEWKAFATSREFQDALMKALAVCRIKSAISFVNDTRKLELVSDEDQRWIRYTWAPLAIEAGLKRIAIVMAQHGLGKMAINGMFKGRRNTGAQLDSRICDSVQDALDWVGML